MNSYPAVHDLGRIDVIELDDTPALSRDVADDIAAIQAAWPDFEGSFDSLQGRKMMGLIYGDIGPAFDVLFEHADHDAQRPHIEYYRREGEVDCLVPINTSN